MWRRKIEPTVGLAKLPSDFAQNTDRVRKPLLCNLALAGTNSPVANSGANSPNEVSSAGSLRQRKHRLNTTQQVAIVNPTVGQDLGEREAAPQGHNKGAVSNGFRRRLTDSPPARPSNFPPQGEPIQFDLDPR